jgi:hypothetical protein
MAEVVDIRSRVRAYKHVARELVEEFEQEQLGDQAGGQFAAELRCLAERIDLRVLIPELRELPSLAEFSVKV